ncbi:CdaR family protein [Streptococcus respiraculi]|uniref:CdaR family protein n=1 Tax=Streptococcus respiraculi TaxID=2021971 RepID=UPI000E76C166|nr:CdaR family protein [Streptococcus respiraculi]
MHDKLKKVGHLFLSVLIALVLFFYATTTNYKNSITTANTTKKVTESETYTHTITNVPIEMKYDNENYFISGFSPTVTVSLTASNRVILQRESDESTRTFSVVTDLNGLASGTHAIELVASNLPTGVKAKLAPNTVTVKIGKKVSKSYSVQGVITNNQLAEGYSLGKVTVNVSSVKVTTDEDTMSHIDHVEAVVPDASNLDTNYSGTATLQAVDNQGNVLPVVLSQDGATLQATITKTK